MDLLESRATAAGEAEQDQLRHAILAAVLYLNELGEQGARTGGFTHQEPGRGAMLPIKDLNIQRHILSTQFAMYGLSSFAAKGVAAMRTWLTRRSNYAGRHGAGSTITAAATWSSIP